MSRLLAPDKNPRLSQIQHGFQYSCRKSVTARLLRCGPDEEPERDKSSPRNWYNACSSFYSYSQFQRTDFPVALGHLLQVRRVAGVTG